jgi:mRNA-degrading endonuclease RelE of RelBE toxin-antitoxin system
MMTWTITHKPAYDTDFIELNKSLQHAAVKALQELEQDPITLRGDTIKPLKGWENVWRYRIGDHRLIYAAHPPSQMVQLLAIGPRASIYERFNYEGWDLPEASAEFGPRLAGQPEWMGHPEWFAPKKDQPPELTPEPLPRRLTPTLLSRWRIDPAYHDVLVHCRTDDELYKLSQAQVPADVLSRVIDSLYPAEAERIASQPDQVLFQPEDLLRYAEGTLTGFLLRLDETQKPLTDWALAGPTLVKGGPGSGKSTVALYRVHRTSSGARADG